MPDVQIGRKRLLLPACATFLVTTVVTVLMVPAPAAAYPRPGRTELVSVATDGGQGDGASRYQTAISGDGRFVGFASIAGNLVDGDTNRTWDVFVHDRTTGVTERVSVATGGAEGKGLSADPAISADGRYVAFGSTAPNLVSGDTNGLKDVFVHDRETGATERVSVGVGSTQGNGSSGNFGPTISANGRYIGFASTASNLVVGDTNGDDIIWDLDVFVHDRVAGTTERVSVADDGSQAGLNSRSVPGQLSADGRHVVFSSSASNLVPNDGNDSWDVFVHDRVTGTTERVSVAGNGEEGDDRSSRARLSADGRYVSFDSDAANLVPADTNGQRDVFVHNRATGMTERVSVAGDGAQSNEASSFLYPSLTADGRYVAFDSLASNLVSGDTNGFTDMFVRDRGPATGVGDLSAAPDGQRLAVAGWATFSGTVATSAADPRGDAADGAEESGGDLVGAAVTYRPEGEDLLISLKLASLPSRGESCHGESPAEVCEQGGGTSGALAPGLLHQRMDYRVGFAVDGVRHEVRISTGSTVRVADQVESEPARFTLYRCDHGCTEQTTLRGGIGVTGAEVRTAVPLAALGTSEGAVLTGITATTSAEDTTLNPGGTLDQVDLSDAGVPNATVRLGIARAQVPPALVRFDTVAAATEGRFSGAFDLASLRPGVYRVWARACVAQTCGTRSVEVDLR